MSGFNDINKVIAPVVQRQMASFLEDYGYEAIPIMYYCHNIAGRHNMTTGGVTVDEILPDEVKEYAYNIINGTDDLTVDGKPYPTDEEIKKNVTDKVSYVVNAKNDFHSPAALCRDGLFRIFF